jgi:rhamnogalacturonyl hydrolase YesR
MDRTEKVISAMLAMQRYSWEQGVCAQALYELGRDELWIPMAYDAIKRMSPDGRLAMIAGDEPVSDPASCGEVCLRAYERTGDEFFFDGAKRMLDYLLKEAPRTGDGIICHNKVSFAKEFSARQLWVDGLYMVPPFLAAMGEVELAAEQIRGYRKHLFDEEADLFFHIVDVEKGQFVRKKHWATGNGWALMGLSRVIEQALDRGEKEIAREFTDLLLRLLKGMLRYSLPDGRFKDVLDDESSFIDGASAMMMAATVYRGIKAGYIPGEYLSAAEKAYETVSSKIDDYGLVREVCGCPDFSREGTSAEAQAAYILATAHRPV